MAPDFAGGFWDLCPSKTLTSPRRLWVVRGRRYKKITRLKLIVLYIINQVIKLKYNIIRIH